MGWGVLPVNERWVGLSDCYGPIVAIEAHLSPGSAQTMSPTRLASQMRMHLCFYPFSFIRSTSKKFALSCSSQKRQTFVNFNHMLSIKTSILYT